MKIDNETKAEIIATCRKAVIEMNEIYNEEWLPADEFCKRVPLFKPEWVRRYHRKLPNEHMQWTDKDGKTHDCTRCFPTKRILRMIAEGKFRDVRINGPAIK